MKIDLKPPLWATHLQSDLTDWRKAPIPVAELTTLEIPDDAFLEYAWQDEAGERRADPANENPRTNPWWDFACHLAGPDYRPDQWLVESGVRPLGRVLRMSIPSVHFSSERQVLVYSPPGEAESSLPAIYFQDGKAYYGWGRVSQVLDRLMAAGLVPAAHLVFVTPSQRTVEYGFNDNYLRHMVEEVLPTVESRINCNGQRTAWGASLGGLCSAYLAWEYPELFQQVVSQSGAYLFDPDMDYTHPWQGRSAFLQKVQNEPARDLSWHLDCGTIEWLTASNEQMFAALFGIWNEGGSGAEERWAQLGKLAQRIVRWIDLRPAGQRLTEVPAESRLDPQYETDLIPELADPLEGLARQVAIWA